MILNPFEYFVAILTFVVLMPVVARLFDGTAFRDEASGLAMLTYMAVMEVYARWKSRSHGERTGPIWHPVLLFGLPGVTMLIAALAFVGTRYQLPAGIAGLVIGFLLAQLTIRRVSGATSSV